VGGTGNVTRDYIYIKDAMPVFIGVLSKQTLRNACLSGIGKGTTMNESSCSSYKKYRQPLKITMEKNVSLMSLMCLYFPSPGFSLRSVFHPLYDSP
jgi:hypothetical protein